MEKGTEKNLLFLLINFKTFHIYRRLGMERQQIQHQKKIIINKKITNKNWWWKS